MRWYREREEGGDKNGEGEGARAGNHLPVASERSTQSRREISVQTLTGRLTDRRRRPSDRWEGEWPARLPDGRRLCRRLRAKTSKALFSSLSRYRGVPLCFLLPSRVVPLPPLSVSVPASARARSLSSLAAAPSSFPPPPPQSIFPLPLPLPLSSVVHSSLVSLRRRLLERAAACPSLPLSSLPVVASPLSLFPARQLFSRGEGDGACFSPGGLQNNKRTREEGAWAEVE